MFLAVPGQVVEIPAEGTDLRWGWVDFSGLRRQVSLACVPDAGVGDFVLVHAGIALSVVDEAEARKVLAMIDELEQTDDGGWLDAPPG